MKTLQHILALDTTTFADKNVVTTAARGQFRPRSMSTFVQESPESSFLAVGLHATADDSRECCVIKTMA